MKLQTKISLGVLPLILFSFLALTLWSNKTAEKQIRLAEYNQLTAIINFFYQEELVRSHSLLKRNNLENVPSFVNSYQQRALANIPLHYTTENGHFLILDNDGSIIFGTGKFNNQKKTGATFHPLASTDNEQEITLPGHVENLGFHNMYVVKHFQPWEWTIFLLKDDDVVHAFTDSINRAAVGVASTCAISSFLLIVFLFQRFLSHPIQLLTTAADTISKRQPVRKIKIYSTDELGLLARNIEKMSKDISQYQNHLLSWQEKLEEKVQKRTDSLNEELHFHRQTQQSLLNSEELLNEVGAIAILGGCEFDLINKGTKWTNQTYLILGFSESAPLPDPSQFSELFLPEYSGQIREALEHARIHGAEYTLEAETVSNKRWCKLILRGIRTNNTTIKIRGTIQDITYQKKIEIKNKSLQTQLLQAQKLESIGQLAAGIAHEINTPAQYLSSNIDFIKESFEDINDVMNELLTISVTNPQSPQFKEKIEAVQNKLSEADWEFLAEEIPKSIEQSQEGIIRITTIVQAMKEFSHPGTKEKDLKDLNHIIKNTVTVARNEWKYVADVVFNLAKDLPLVPCRANEIGQVILNIIVNSAHAIAQQIDKTPEIEKGTISIATQFTQEWIELKISDTGTGIPKEIETKLFDPFFTTKEVGKGSGQGLAIVYDIIVNKHSGTVTIESAPNQGSTFIISLPRNNPDTNKKE